MGIYRDLGVEPIVNASGSLTRLGGAPMPQAVLDAFSAAAAECVPLDQLQGAASRIIAEITGAEAGIVTSGASAALTLGAAAILARFDPGSGVCRKNCEQEYSSRKRRKRGTASRLSCRAFNYVNRRRLEKRNEN
jgi:L-seryl-tRNA(Ser) seleniumtransferase